MYREFFKQCYERERFISWTLLNERRILLDSVIINQNNMLSIISYNIKSQKYTLSVEISTPAGYIYVYHYKSATHVWLDFLNRKYHGEQLSTDNLEAEALELIPKFERYIKIPKDYSNINIVLEKAIIVKDNRILCECKPEKFSLPTKGSFLRNKPHTNLKTLYSLLNLDFEIKR
jgi:hypothetical protein